MKRLRCSVCGAAAYGKQWWNRDKGYGICMKCVELVLEKEGKEALVRGYGHAGIHYSTVPEDREPEPSAVLEWYGDYFLAHATGKVIPLPLGD